MWKLIIVVALGAAQLWQARAEQPPPLSALFRRADLVLVGSVRAAKRIPASDARSKSSPIAPLLFAPIHPCELTLAKISLLKGDIAADINSTLSVVTYLTSSACAVDYSNRSVSIGVPALWLLRIEGSVVRTVVDNAETMHTFHSLAGEVRQRLNEWNDPALSVMYLFLKPGIIPPEKDYATRVDVGEVVDLGGWRALLRVYRAIYLESDEEMRAQIALVAASFGHCLDLASRVAQGDERATWESRLPDIRPDVRRRTDELEMRRMSWTTKEEVLASFQSPADAVDELTLRACSSAPRSKVRARQLLLRYFGVGESVLPCLPCD